MNEHRFRWLGVLLVSLALVLSGCSSSDGGGGTTVGAVGTGDGSKTGELNDDGIDTGIAATATTVAGKVTLSSVLTQKARAKAAREEALRFGKPGSAAYNRAMQKARIQPSFAGEGAAFSGGKVFLYNATRPEWTKPVAEAVTDSEGIYTLSELSNAADNDNAYTDGDQIPGGNYTLLAFTEKDYGLFKLPDLVALQSVVSEFAGEVPGVDLEAQKSSASPTITTMLGVTKNKDGTQTWGGSDLELAPNAAVQVAFSMPMFREAITDTFLKLASTDGGTVPEGLWTLSADWLTATYYPNEGETWSPGSTYTVSVSGRDSDSGIAIYNIFGRFLEKSGVGTFKVLELAAGQTVEDLVDTVPPTAQIASPTLAQTANPIEITTPLRIASNERMDVNGLRLRAEPSLGAQPGVLFIGKNDDSLYEYEFLLGEPMKLGTSYTVTVSGGKDLAGNIMNELKVSFGTEAQSEGVIAITAEEGTAEYETQVAQANDQADVKDVFGKWVRAFNDRNLPQLQSLMSGEFEMQYNTADGYQPDDINRDGALDMNEFSDMISTAFLAWDLCEIDVTGSIDGDINVDTVNKVSDFAFKLAFEPGISSPDCKQAAEDQDLFANLDKVNGAWYIRRASEGVDNRESEVVAAAPITLVQPLEDDDSIVFYDEATQQEVDVTFEWTEVADASAYIWMVFDSRNPASGLALILPSTMTSMEIPSGIDTLMDNGTIAEVATAFGFTDQFEPRDGSELMWQVAALGKNTVADVSGGRATDLPGDVIGISELWRFKIPGEYQELAYSVALNDSSLAFFRDSRNNAELNPEKTYEGRLDGTDGAAVTYNELINGFDAGDSSFVTITVTTPRAGDVTQGFVEVNGNTRFEKAFNFDENGVGSLTVPLSQGTSQVMISDAVPCWYNHGDCSDDNGDRGIEEWFQVVTTGGIKPIVFFGDGVDSTGIVPVDADGVAGSELVDEGGWNWFESTDAVKLQLTGKVNLNAGVFENGPKPQGVRIDVGNESGARTASKAKLDDQGNFSVEVEIYNGDNWVNVSTSVCTEQNDDGYCPDYARRDFHDHFGIYTQAGSEYVPPIRDIVVADAEDSTAVVAQKENWGDGGRWNASAVTGNVVTISGVMEFATDTSGGNREPEFSVGSDGGWMNDKLSVAPDGSFSFTVELFHGDNWIDIRDVSDNNYHLNIRTDLGKEVIRPEITEIITMEAGATEETVTAYTGGDITTSACSITIKGTAMEGNIEAFWRGEVEETDETAGTSMRKYFWEQAKTETTEQADGSHTFTLTFPVVGNSAGWSENFIDINDNNWNWMGVRIINSTADCEYVAPEMAITAVKDSAGNTLDKVNDWGNGGQWGPAGSGSTNFKAFEGSVGLDITAPADNTTGLGTGTTISGSVDLGVIPMTGSEVVRVMVNDEQYNLVAFASSSSLDSMVGQTGGSTFTVDSSTGDFSVDVDLSGPAIIEVLVWTDMNADPSTTNPVAGHEIPVNGAVLGGGDTGSVDCSINPDDPACTDTGSTGGDTGGTSGDTSGTGGYDNGGSSFTVTTDSITIEGTSNVAGRSINIDLDGCGGPERYTAVASDTETSAGSGEYAWSTSAITVYSGRNNINVSNGPQWMHVELEAESNATLPDPALVVTMTGATEVVDANKPEECGRSNWDAGDGSTVTISGTTTAPDGEGEWRADGQFGRFAIVDGAFTIADMPLYNGFNRFEINDTQWNRHEMYIETTGGTARPQFVDIDQTTLAIGTGKVISGTIYGKAKDGLQADLFVPRNVNINVNVGDMYMEFVSDPNELQWRPDAEVMTLTPVDGTDNFTFSVNVDVPAASWDSSGNTAESIWVNVWVDGDVMDAQGNPMWANHGISTSINSDCTDCTNYYKPKVRK